MELCTNQDVKKYGGFIGEAEVGLYKTYRDRPALLAAVMLMTSAPFQYEEGSVVPMEERLNNLTPDWEGRLTDTLDDTVGNKMILTLLETMTPLQVLQYLQGFDLSHLAIRRIYVSDASLGLIIMARVSVWCSAKDCRPADKVFDAKLLKSETRVREAVNGSYIQASSKH